MPSPAPRRPTRGLLDPIGALVHNIFGLATESEIKDIQQVISTMHSDDTAIVHRLSEFTTLVNRTRAYEEETRNFVNAMSKRFGQVNMWLAGLQDDVNEVTYMVNFERILEDLELKGKTVYQLHQLYSHRRQDLHSGRLSEELLSVASLAHIFDSIRSVETAPLTDLNWYYAHSVVRPMWAAQEFLVYEVILHLVRPETFLLYRLHAWPTPLVNRTSAHIQEGGDFGYNTANGDLFAATECRGQDPRVCDSGPLYGDSHSALPCVRGILTGNKVLMGKCKVELVAQPQTRIYTLRDNEYVISSFGELLTTRCVGKSAIQTRLVQGIHQIHVNHSCSIFGQGWSLSSILQKSITTHLITQHLHRPHPMNLSALLSPLLALSTPTVFSDSYPTLAGIEPLPLDVWTTPGLHAPHWKPATPWWTWALLVLITLVVTCLATYCLYMRYRCDGLGRVLACWKIGRFSPCASTPRPQSKIEQAEAGQFPPTPGSAPQDPAFHDILLNTLGIHQDVPTDPYRAPTYSHLRGLLKGGEEPEVTGHE